MKLQIALVLFGFCSLAGAEIYKYVDPATGAVEYTRTPKKDATPLAYSGQSIATTESSDAPYRCDEPGNSTPLYRRWPELGCVVLASGELLDTDEALLLEKKKRLAIQQIKTAANVARLKKMRDAYAALAKTHPKACSRVDGEVVCTPTPGMSMKLLADAMELERSSYTLTPFGRSEMYRHESCWIYAREGKVTIVTCS